MTGEFIGLREANAALRQLPEFAKAQAQLEMDVTASRVAAAAAGRVRRRTGRLATAIQWRSRPKSVQAVVGIADPEAFYWKFLEYGTVKMPAAPFLRPAAESQQADHQARLVAALERAGQQVERAAIGASGVGLL